MTRDYAKRNYRVQSGKRAKSKRWFWLIFGITAGSLITQSLYQFKSFDSIASYFRFTKTHHATTSNIPNNSNALSTKSATQTADNQATSIAKPHFDFYTVLPNNHVAMIDDEPDETIENAKNPEQKSTYTIQIASLSNYHAADQLRAELLLMGFTANLQKIERKEGNLYRVWMGPYALPEAQTIQKRLSQNNVKSSLEKA